MNERIVRVAGWLGVGAVGCISAIAHAQTVDLQTAVYAEVPAYGVDAAVRSLRALGSVPADGTLVPSPFLTSSDPDSRKVMAMSDAGTLGLVLAGKAQVGPADARTPAAPWIAKVSQDDAHELWSWHLPFDPAQRGSFSEIAIDDQGDVVAIGNQFLGQEPSRFLLMKLGGASGDVQWRIDGPEEFRGYSVALDAQGNVAMTAAEDLGEQIVARYAGANGAPIWSKMLPDAATGMDDYRVSTNAAGDVAAAGAYRVVATSEYGVQVAKLDAADGSVAWQRRFVGTFMSAIQVLRLLPDGDVLVIGSLGPGGPLARLNGDTGEVRWERGDVGEAALEVDSEGQLLVGGIVHPGAGDGLADVQRIDAETGQTLWRWQLPGQFYTVVRALTFDRNGDALIALSEGDMWIPQEAARLDLHSGGLRWIAVPPRGGYATEDDFSVGVLAGDDGSVYFGGYDHGDMGEATWTVFRVAPIADDVTFLNGFD